jgi:hypothetical protein
LSEAPPLREALSPSAWNRDALVASPAFAAVAPWLERLPRDRFPAIDDLNALLGDEPEAVRSGEGARIRFVDAATIDGEVPDVPAALATNYEMRIARTGVVPTRAGNWHDLLNALVWIAFPRTKAVLNGLHAAVLRASPEDATRRGPVRDTLTLFDEGGAIVACADASLDRLLRDHAWRPLFVDRRDAVRAGLRAFVFGHAVLEKLVRPYRGISARALVVPMSTSVSGDALHRALDDAAATHFAHTGVPAGTDAARWKAAFTPLPLLGMPGWDPENADAAYYDDAQHFRPRRMATGGARPT